jgi:methylated-DNA-[protein]-cysteine S-methyltransferase
MQNPRKVPVKTKAGTFVLELSSKGLCAVRFPGDRNVEGGRHSLAPLLRKLRRARIDLEGYTVFQKRVYKVLQKVPPGKVITYGELAKRAGYPGAARAVGSAMKKNRLPLVIPCHRVLPSAGGIGEYSAGKGWKRWLLELEGVAVSTYHRIKLKKE